MAFVYITCKNKKEAIQISEYLLKKRLVGCANFFPIESRYWWKGKIRVDREYAILVKTLTSFYEKIKKEVSKKHSYTVPCVCLIYAKVNTPYDNWLKKELMRK